MTPTQEQEIILSLSRKREPLKINAYAGTGKTSTLHLIAGDSSRRGHYLAFNKAIAADAASRFPQHITCTTNHSVAYRAVSSQAGYENAKMTGQANANLVAEALKLPEWQHCNRTLVLSRQSFGALLLDALRVFLRSSEPKPLPSHFPRYDKLASLTASEFSDFTAVAVKGVEALWRRMLDRRDVFPLGHDGYVKLWALSAPQLPVDYVMLDEAQDSNPVILGVLVKQQCPVIYVGDPYRQIYEWRGAINAMENVDTPHRALLSQSFRFGERIASAATQVLRYLDAIEPVRGHEEFDSHVAHVHPAAILARTNAGVIENLLTLQQQNVSCHVVGGSVELKKLLEHVSRLRQGIASDLPEFFGFRNWHEVIVFSQEPEGSHLRTFVKLVDTHGEAKLLMAVTRCQTSERDAQVCLSTAHRAKGKEWSYVRLDDDFDASFPDQSIKRPDVLREPKGEARLLYVAMTRGKLGIEMPEGCRKFFNIAHTTTERVGIPLYGAPTNRLVMPSAPTNQRSGGGVSEFLKKIFG